MTLPATIAGGAIGRGNMISPSFPAAQAPAAPVSAAPVEDALRRETPRGAFMGFVESSQRGNRAAAAEAGLIPASVKWAFYTGGLIYISAVLWTIFSTKEYPPDEFEAYNAHETDKAAKEGDELVLDTKKYFTSGLSMIMAPSPSHRLSSEYIPFLRLKVGW